MKKIVLSFTLSILCAPATAESIQEFVIALSHQLHEEKLPYSSNPADFRDCSGIFHRLLGQVQSFCPELPRPAAGQFRASRSVAEWYHQQGSLTLIHDALTEDKLIQPGVVMFYGHSRREYVNITLAQAFTDISHVGVVTDVTRDKDGQVISYRLFHGRSGTNPAAITDYHWRKPSRPGYPPLGNGRQQWVAVAQLCVDTACVCETPLPASLKQKLISKRQEYLPTQQKLIEAASASGLASWYGGKFHGRKTASGEIFSRHQLTAAHRSLPFGTRLKVTNIRNNHSVIVKINDRGPYAGNNRVIDLSEAAANYIKMKHVGIVPVRLEVLGHGY